MNKYVSKLHYRGSIAEKGNKITFLIIRVLGVEPSLKRLVFPGALKIGFDSFDVFLDLITELQRHFGCKYIYQREMDYAGGHGCKEVGILSGDGVQHHAAVFCQG